MVSNRIKSFHSNLICDVNDGIKKAAHGVNWIINEAKAEIELHYKEFKDRTFI